MQHLEYEIRSWEHNYQKGRYNQWPYDLVVSLVLRNYGHLDRSQVKILDLGCGGGNNTFFLAKSGFATFAVDGSPTSIEITRKRLSENKLEATFALANFKDLPFQNDFFDCIIDRASVYCNLWADIIKIRDQILRVLKPGGRYMGFLPSQKHPDVFLGREIERNTYTDFSAGSFSHSDLAHFFSVQEIRDLFADFQLEIVLEHSLEPVIEEAKSYWGMVDLIVVARK